MSRSVPDRLYGIGAFLLIALGIARLIPTYTTFTQTYDEPTHIACGMEWLDQGIHDCGLEHPPLAQIAVALGPYLSGIRPILHDGGVDEGNEILYSRGEYVHNLMLARLGNLPFFVLAAAVVYLWARRWFSAAAGFWSVLLFVTLPPVLGHASLATLDMAACATVLAALYQWMRWIEAPGWSRVVALAVASSLTLLTKFSSVVFLPACFAVGFVHLGLTQGRAAFRRVACVNRLRQASAAAGLIFIFVWAGYRFGVEPALLGNRAHPSVERLVAGSPLLGGLVMKAVLVPLPLAGMLRGLGRLYIQNHFPAPSYLLGGMSQRGRWEFFPVAFAVKTPIGFLLLAAWGMVLVVMRSAQNGWQRSLTAYFVFAILFACMASRINLGIRHALSVYPFAAILAGQAVALSLRSNRRFIAVGSMVLVCWVIVDSWSAHPDYLAYFNPLAGPQPEKILAESDLDWGQDLRRLSERLKALGVEELSIAYFGTARLESADLPRYRVLESAETASGYIAVSVRYLTLEHARNGSYSWLRSLTPMERIGKSIYLFHVAP